MKLRDNLHRRAIQLVLVVVVSSLIAVPSPVRGDAPAPSFAVGDWWKFDLQNYGGGGSRNATVTITIVAEETVTVSGGTYDSLKAKTTASGPFAASSGPILNGSWNVSGTLYARKSDFAELKNSFKTTTFNTSAWVTQIAEEIPNAPIIGVSWPLSVGKAWLVSTQTSNNITNYNSLNPTPVSTQFTSTISGNYTVNRTETTSVAAGTFETFMITRNDSATNQRIWYSPQVGTSVKVLNYDRNSGTLLANQTLTGYYAWPYKSSFSVSSGGRSFNLLLRGTAAITNPRQDSTSVSFEVSGQVPGSTGISARANITIPKQMNSSVVRVLVDSKQVSATVSQNATDYFVFFTFTLSTHTVTLFFAPEPGFFSNPYVLAGIGAAVVAILGFSLVLVRRRRKGPELAQRPVQQGIANP